MIANWVIEFTHCNRPTMQSHCYDLTQHLRQGKGHLPSEIPLEKSVAMFINLAGYFQACLTDVKHRSEKSVLHKTWISSLLSKEKALQVIKKHFNLFPPLSINCIRRASPNCYRGSHQFDYLQCHTLTSCRLPSLFKWKDCLITSLLTPTSLCATAL